VRKMFLFFRSRFKQAEIWSQLECLAVVQKSALIIML